jgi:hypothetical protein
VTRLLTDWRAKNAGAERSLTSRLDAAAAGIAHLREKMDRLAESISETSDRESRRTLQEKLDVYSDQVRAAEGKRERLLSEAHDAAAQTQTAHEIRAWVRAIRDEAETFTPVEQRATLRALGAQATIWRAGEVQPDGWAQYYRIELTFTGFTGQPIILPARCAAEHADNEHHVSDYL